MKTVIFATIIVTLTLTTAAAHAAQREIKGYWTDGKECIAVYRCTSDLECERKNPHIKEEIRRTHVFVTDKDQCGENHENEEN